MELHDGIIGKVEVRVTLFGNLALLVEQVVRTDCDRCGSDTDQLVLDYGDRPMLCRCVKCGRVKRYPGSKLRDAV